MCRKLETEEEKIIPFYATSLSEEEESEIKQALLESPGPELSNVIKKLFELRFKRLVSCNYCFRS